MATVWYVLFYSLIGGIFSLLGGIILLGTPKRAQALARYATPFAGGALLAAVFLDLLKEGVEVSDPGRVLLATLIGMMLFFFAEGFLHWFHHHHTVDDEHKDHHDPSAWLVVVGDTLHNALDGVAIGAAFLISIPTGIVTTIAVAAHEIPQEIGDFGLLLSKGMRRRSVLMVNMLSAFATVALALLTFSIGDQNTSQLGVLLGLSAGFLLYIAASDIIPTIHARQRTKRLFDTQALLFLLGVIVVAIVTSVAHNYIGEDHTHLHSDYDHSHSVYEEHDEALHHEH